MDSKIKIPQLIIAAFMGALFILPDFWEWIFRSL